MAKSTLKIPERLVKENVEGSLPILEQLGIMEILRGMNQGMYHNDHSNMGKNGRR